MLYQIVAGQVTRTMLDPVGMNSFSLSFGVPFGQRKGVEHVRLSQARLQRIHLAYFRSHLSGDSVLSSPAITLFI